MDTETGTSLSAASSEWVIRKSPHKGDVPDINERLPPVVVAVSIPTGSTEVPPGDCEISVRFSEPMMDESWSVVEYAPNSTPSLTEAPRLSPDGLTLMLKARLEASRIYAFWLNDAHHANFRDRDGRPLIPYLIGFQTAQQREEG